MKKNIKLYKFNEIDSTNEYLRKNHKSYEEFDVISARVQTHGKARRQNDWVSMDGMALFSFFLKERDNWEIEDYLKLPLIAGIAVIKGLRKIENLEYKFKWTNDVYVENMKLCGILIEKTEDVYITGIGINVNNMLPENLKSKAISLTQIKNKKYEIDEVIKNIVLEFQTLCENLENGFWKDILKEIKQINYLKLPLIAGIAVIKGLIKIENLEYKFKWTNDIYLENKKLCGILVEKTENVYIVGTGINVNNILPENLQNKAISLTQLTNKKYEIDEVIKNIVSEFQILCEQLENGLWENILDEINKINYLKGKRIELKFGNEVISGVAQNIDENGELEILIEKGDNLKPEVRSFSVGEVFEKIVYFS